MKANWFKYFIFIPLLWACNTNLPEETAPSASEKTEQESIEDSLEVSPAPIEADYEALLNMLEEFAKAYTPLLQLPSPKLPELNKELKSAVLELQNQRPVELRQVLTIIFIKYQQALQKCCAEYYDAELIDRQERELEVIYKHLLSEYLASRSLAFNKKQIAFYYIKDNPVLLKNKAISRPYYSLMQMRLLE